MDRHVVAGVDGTAASLAAAHWAAREARRRGVPLRLVHVWQWSPRPAASVPLGTTQVGWATQTLDGAVAGVGAAYPGIPVDGRLVKADSTVGALAEEAADAELMVLGSNGLGGFAGFVLGSVSQRVVARSPRPVVLVRAGQTSAGEHLPAVDGVSPEEIPETPYRDVVLGLDTRRPCDELIEFAFETARRRDARLHAIHVFSASSELTEESRTEPVPGPELLAAQERTVVATLRPWCEKFPGVPVVETVAEGRVAAELVRASTGASLVVVGRRTRSGRLGNHVGPVTHGVLHHVGCPVAVVPHD